MADRRRAHQGLTEHRHWRYRGCAPHWDDKLPGRALGDEELSTDAWIAPDDEPQEERLAREAAVKAVCATCPVLSACREYALADDGAGQPMEPYDIWGGMTAGERREVLLRRRALGASGPVGSLPSIAYTEPKRRVLAALAAHTSQEAVAEAAEMSVRAANWHRSLLAGVLGLDKAVATRGDLLAAAARWGLLPDGTVVVPCDGQVLAAPASESAARRETPAPTVSGTAPTVAEPDDHTTPRQRTIRVPAPRRRRFAAVPGQLALDLAVPPRTTPPRTVPSVRRTRPVTALPASRPGAGRTRTARPRTLEPAA